MSDRTECVVTTLVASRPSRTNDPRARTRRAPRSPTAMREGSIDRNARSSTPPRDLSSNRLRSFFCFYVFRSLCHRLTLLLPSFPQHPHQQHHPRRVRERALEGQTGWCNISIHTPAHARNTSRSIAKVVLLVFIVRLVLVSSRFARPASRLSRSKRARRLAPISQVSTYPFEAANRRVLPVHAQPLSRAHLSTSRWPPSAA